MSTAVGMVILAQVMVALFVIWGFLHEDLFIRFENSVSRALRVKRTQRLKAKSAKRLKVVVDRSTQNAPDYTAA